MRDRPYAKLTILLIPVAFFATYLAIEALPRSVEFRLPLWLSVYWSIYTAAMLHVAVMGLLGALWLGLRIEQMSFGVGKRWFRTNIARIPISFGLLFTNSYVKFSDEVQSIGWRRCVLELSGCAVLFALAAAIMGRRAPIDVLGFWQQLFAGALSPFAHAQAVLLDLGGYLSELDQVSILAVVSFGIAAFNLLPLP